MFLAMFGHKKLLKNHLVACGYTCSWKLFYMCLFVYAFFFDWTPGNVDTLLYTYDGNFLKVVNFEISRHYLVSNFNLICTCTECYLYSSITQNGGRRSYYISNYFESHKAFCILSSYKYRVDLLTLQAPISTYKFFKLVSIHFLISLICSHVWPFLCLKMRITVSHFFLRI